MHGLEEEQPHRLLHVRDAPAREPLDERSPRPRLIGHDLAPAEKHVAGVGLEFETQSLLGEDPGAVEMLETRDGVAAVEERPAVAGKAERRTEGLLDQAPASAPGLLGVR